MEMSQRTLQPVCETVLILSAASYLVATAVPRDPLRRQGDQRSFRWIDEYPRLVGLGLVLGFLASGPIGWEDQRVKDQISGLELENEMLVRRNEQLSYMDGLDRWIFDGFHHRHPGGSLLP